MAAQGGDDYFNSYCDLTVHELMLQDRPRTTSYRKFFENHQDLVKGKIVMDVGAGTGILSLFAATAGAKKVYAVEASQVASLCQEIVTENGFDSVIEVIHGAVEDVKLPDGVKVDVIVSEWMGFYLLHESMLDSVLVARDKFLAPNGIMAPSRACLYLAPVDMSEHFQDRADYWSNIYGYDFSPIASTFNIQEVSKPLIKALPPSTVKAEAEMLLDLDLKTMNVEDVKSFSKNCRFLMSDESRIHGFAAWFDVVFDGTGSCDRLKQKDSHSKDCRSVSNHHPDPIDSTGDAKPVVSKNGDCESPDDKVSVNSKSISKVTSAPNPDAADSSIRLSTSPPCPPTHWKQTVVFLPQTIMVMEGVDLCCRVTMSQDADNKRHYNISITLVDGLGIDDDGDYDDSGENSEKGGGGGGEGDEQDSSGAENSDDSCDHPVPCDCGSNRCRLISALVDKYDTEHQELVEEAEMVETEAEMEAAKEIDSAIETEGWSLDASGTDGADHK